MCIDLKQAHQRGVSLIETVLFIVVVSIALVVVLKAFDISNQGSADPVLRRQALAIAQSLLDEISAKPFGGADTDDVSQGGFAGPYTAANRQFFDDVDDYHGFAMNGIATLGNVAVVGLEQYTAAITVTLTKFGNVPFGSGYRISVSVTDPANRQIQLDTFRARY